MASDAENLTAAFAAADKGDAAPLVELFHDDMTWAGFALDGTQKVYTKREFLEAFGVLAQVDEFANEVVRTETNPRASSSPGCGSTASSASTSSTSP